MRKNNYILSVAIGALIATQSATYALQPSPMSYPFPMDRYDQKTEDWIQPGSDWDKPLLDAHVQQAQYENFKTHWLLSWDDELSEPSNADLNIAQDINIKERDKNYTCSWQGRSEVCELKPKAESSIGRISCNRKDANFNVPYSDSWIEGLRAQVALSQFQNGTNVRGKAIAIDNLNARSLPTDDHYFDDCNLPGEGDSFDYLQVSAVWAGTPLYILGESADKKWYLIRNSDFVGWVKSEGVIRVSDKFISIWKNALNRENSLVAINSAMNAGSFAISDAATNTKRFLGFVGAIFPVDPAMKSDGKGFHVLIPIKESDLPVSAYLSKDNAVLMPYASTPSNYVQVINHMKGRTYGWGSLNVDNPTDFLNDCSQELKSLYTPFGIWLPRHSSSQVDPNQMLGTVIDLTAKSPEERLATLVNNGHRFTTIFYIGNHIIMYLGNYMNPIDKTTVALTYQNLWGLRPAPGSYPAVDNMPAKPYPDGRYVIGKSVIFPLLLQYPEKFPYPVARDLGSLAGKPFFIVAYLDQLPPLPMASFVNMSVGKYLGLKKTMSLGELQMLMRAGS